MGQEQTKAGYCMTDDSKPQLLVNISHVFVCLCVYACVQYISVCCLENRDGMSTLFTLQKKKELSVMPAFTSLILVLTFVQTYLIYFGTSAVISFIICSANLV